MYIVPDPPIFCSDIGPGPACGLFALDCVIAGATTAGKANPLLLPSFATAFHSCNKESSPLIDKVRNIVDES